MSPQMQIFLSAVSRTHRDVLAAEDHLHPTTTRQLWSLCSSHISELRFWEALKPDVMTGSCNITSKSSIPLCKSLVWILAYESAHQDMWWGMSAVFLHHVTEADFYVRPGNKGTTFLLGHVVTSAPVTRSHIYSLASKFDMCCRWYFPSCRSLWH